MMDPAEQIRNEIGKLHYIALRKFLRSIQITIDAEDKMVTVYRDGREPIRISFRDLEKFVNDLH